MNMSIETAENIINFAEETSNLEDALIVIVKHQANKLVELKTMLDSLKRDIEFLKLNVAWNDTRRNEDQ